VKIANEIDLDEESGAAMPNGDQLYIPTASGFYHDGKPHPLQGKGSGLL